jgi:hypothetical protein
LLFERAGEVFEWFVGHRANMRNGDVSDTHRITSLGCLPVLIVKENAGEDNARQREGSRLC